MTKEQILENRNQSWFTEEGEMDNESSFIAWKDALDAMEEYRQSSPVESKWVSEYDKAKFWSKCNYGEYCWEWQGSKDACGYGRVRIGDKSYLAHRIAFQIINGKVDDSIHILHRCDNPACVNPNHLFSGTHKENMIDKMWKGRSRHTDKTSKYRGVGWRDDSKRWRAYWMADGKRKNIGSFATEIEAAQAYDAEIKRLGLNVPLNFPELPPIEETKEK